MTAQSSTRLAAGPGWASHALAAVMSVHAAYRGEPVEVALRFARRALEEGRLLGERGAGSWAPIHAIGTLVALGENDRGPRRRRRRFARRRSSRARPSVSSRAPAVAAGLDMSQGDLPTGEAEVQSALAMGNAAELPMQITTA